MTGLGDEVVGTCPPCGKPIRRNQPRVLMDKVYDRHEDRVWWKAELKGGTLVHLACADGMAS